MLVLVCMLSACGGGTSFDGSEAQNNVDTSGSDTPDIGSDPDIPDFPVSETPNEPTSQEPTSQEPTPTPLPSDTPQSFGNASAIVSWNIPTTRENGEDLALTDIGGYEILYRRYDEVIFRSLTVSDQSQSERLVEGLAPGRYEFFVLAFDEEGLYSDFSEPAIADISSTSL